MKRVAFELARVSFLVVALVSCFACTNDDGFTQAAQTEFFTQDYNPQFIDVLWMLDDRTSMSFSPYLRDLLRNEASSFFARLDQTASIDYRMAFISADLQYSPPGELKPRYTPLEQKVLFKNLGTLSERVNRFASLLSSVVNLRTGGLNTGLEATRQALMTSFQPRPGVPLVLIFVTDSEDRSTLPAGQDRVDYYSSEYLRLVGNQSDLLRVYSINYTKNGMRCATSSANSDIDSNDSSRFEDQADYKSVYFRLAEKVSGGTGDLCQTWSSGLNLNGLTLKVLPKKFPLKGVPVTGTLIVTVFDKGQSYNIPYTYDAATNEIVFDTVPPQGTSIQVTYHVN